ncbi:MAG TPA: DNA repair and recombination protein RadB [Candidatus Nanoarchaeia archaeon]|nr:DNA repair and recombination protein RadB [Candidatus Nanoarchaeia archaeon]
MVKVEKISTGSYDFNKWLYGGYECDTVTMIAGPPGSGKTNFAILVACSQAKNGNKVIFVDTEGGFSVDRVKQIVGENYKNILEKILLLNPVSFEDQKKAFVNLRNRVKEGQIGVIIIDSIAMLYRLELGDAVKSRKGENIHETNREVARQMTVLAEIARKKKIPVIITNQVYEDFLSLEDIKNGTERTTNIVGGTIFKYWCKCIIELKNNKNKRCALLLKHRSLPQKELSFEIKNKGVFKKSWI